MALIGSVNNQGSIQGQINEANGYLTGVISNAGLLGGQVVGMRGLKGDKGDKGDTGDTGVGISSVAKTSSAGLVDTYTITYTNGNTATFTVTNGQDGHSPVVTATKSGSKTYISVDGTQIAEIVDGDKGDTGATGNGIASITKTGSAGTDPVVDTYTVTYTNGDTDTFTVTNGAKGDTGATPVITAEKVGKVTTVKADGVAFATINDGDDGHSPVITASKVGTTTTIYLDGEVLATIEDGTDTKVTQTVGTPSSYSYWRPLVVGYSSGSSEGFSPSTQTNTTYAFSTLKCQPSTGTIRCGVLDLYKGSYTVKASPDTLTANRTITLPDKSGTMAMTDDIHNVPSGGTSGQVLAKASGTDYDVEWVEQTGGGGDVTDVKVNGTSVVDGDGVASVTVPTITDTYSGTSSNGMSGKAVKSAIDALDGTVSGTAGAGKTLTAFSQTDGKVSATFGNISITKSQISDFPTIPVVNNATLTIQKNGTTVNTFTANASSNVTANITVPTNVSDLNNDSKFCAVQIVRW